MPRKTRTFNTEEYAKAYYKEYYQKNKEKMNQQRNKNHIKNRFKKSFNLELSDEQYELYKTYRTLYDDLIRLLQKEKYELFVKRYNIDIRNLLDKTFVDYLKENVKSILTSSSDQIIYEEQI